MKSSLVMFSIMFFIGNVYAGIQHTQHIKCGYSDSGFDLKLIVENGEINLVESRVSLNGDLSPDWNDIEGQIEEVEERNGYLILSVGSWSAAADDPYNYDVVMKKELLLTSFKRIEQNKLTADGNEEICYSYIELED